MTATDLLPFPGDWDRALAIAAHPDDLEYGVASAAAAWTTAGKSVAYVLATNGAAGIDGMDPERAGPLREDEERAGAREVGVDVVEFLGYDDGVVEAGLALRRDPARAIRRHRPELLITIHHGLTWAGGHLNMADHRNVGIAAIDAARDAGNRWVFPELLADGLEPWNRARRIAVNAASQPTHAVDVTDTIDRGVASLRAQAAYLAGLGDGSNPDAIVRGIAGQAGQQFGGRPAVTFELLTW